MRAASAPAESLPARPSTEPKPTRGFVRQEPAQAERAPTRRFKPTAEPKPEQRAAAPAAPEPKPSVVMPKPISNDEALKNPLVQSVIEVFGGEIKRVHPKTN